VYDVAVLNEPFGVTELDALESIPVPAIFVAVNVNV
jgi:hypothetical protein